MEVGCLGKLPRSVKAAVCTRAEMRALCARVPNSLAVGSEGFEDIVGCLGPGERFGVLIPLVDPLADVGLKFMYAAVG
jgi:hypothetical protein